MAEGLRPIAALSTLVTVAYGALFYGFAVLITDAGAGARFSTSLLSAAYGGAVVTGGLMAIPVGRAADRHGVRRIVVAGSLLGGFGLAGFAAATRPWEVVVLWWGLLGPAMAMTFYEPAYVAIQQWYRAEDRPRAIAMLTFLAGLSGPVFTAGTGSLLPVLGWRATAVTLATALVVVGLVVGLLLLPAARAPSASARGPGDARVRDTVRSPRFVVFTIGAILAFGMIESSVVHRVARFEEVGMPLSTITRWTALSGLLTLPGRFVIPRLAARVPATALLAAVLLSLAAATTLAVDGRAGWEMALYFTGTGVVLGAALPLRALVMAGWYAGPRFGSILGAQAAVIAIARAAGPAGAGLLRDATAGYGTPFTVIALSLALAAGLVLLADRVGPRAPSPAPAVEPWTVGA